MGHPVRHNQRSMLSHFLVFNTSAGILSMPAGFLLLFSFFFVNVLSVISEGFSSRDLKCSFHSKVFLLGGAFLLTFFIIYQISDCPVGWGCRIHCLHFCKGVRPSPKEFPGYDTKQSDGEVPMMLGL